MQLKSGFTPLTWGKHNHNHTVSESPTDSDVYGEVLFLEAINGRKIMHAFPKNTKIHSY
jgi:hypothetical protein